VRIYLSASYKRQQDLRPYRDRLVAAGHVVTSSWIDEDTATGQRWQAPEAAALRRRIGFKDMAEILASDLIISDHTVPSTSGGTHSELGIALAAAMLRFYEMKIWTVGDPQPPRSPFFELADRHFDTWDHIMEELIRGQDL
jgi:hypothetical protein